MTSENNLYDQKSDFWTQYIESRPQIPDNFFDRILRYHVEHGGQFNTLHDAGAGIGVHTARLAKSFDHIIVSDPSQNNIDLAKSFLKQQSNISFKIAKLEDKDGISSSSVDMVFIANAIHFTDVETAMDAVAYQLKPGGSFVCAGSWISVLSDEYSQGLWQKVTQRLFEIHMNGPDSMKKALAIGASTYDAVPVDTKYFRPNALRILVNFPSEWSFLKSMASPIREFEFKTMSRVGDTDIRICESADGWTFKTDIHGLRKQLDTLFFSEMRDDRLTELWKELETTVGDNHVSGTWPAVLILATRNDTMAPV